MDWSNIETVKVLYRLLAVKGMAIAEGVASQLADNDFCLVSGYANGVDMVVHKTA